MLIAVLPVLFMLVGACLYGRAASPKVAELGRLMFQAGAIALCLAYAGKGVTIP